MGIKISFLMGFASSMIFLSMTWILKSLPSRNVSLSTLKPVFPLEASHRHEAFQGLSLADSLFNKTKVLCLIFTHPGNHYTKALHVNRTWGKKCNKLYFMTTQKETDLPTISLPIIETRANLWNKTKETFKWAYTNHLEEYDWFFKGDDDTYAIIENMRYVLSFYNPDEAWLFGSRFKYYSRKGYMSGGGGYMLSRESVRMLVEKGLPDPKICSPGPSGAEDAEIGKCLSAMNVSYGDTRDQFNRWRFFPLQMTSFFQPDSLKGLNWFWNMIYYNISMNMNCCSDTAVSHHYVDPKRMYFYHYMLYHLQAWKKSSSMSYLPKLIFSK